MGNRRKRRSSGKSGRGLWLPAAPPPLDYFVRFDVIY